MVPLAHIPARCTMGTKLKPCISIFQNLHDNDPDSVLSWIQEWETHTHNPILFYKLQGTTCAGFSDEDFMIVIQTEEQKEVFGVPVERGVLCDSTHNTTGYDFKLTSLHNFMTLFVMFSTQLVYRTFCFQFPLVEGCTGSCASGFPSSSIPGHLWPRAFFHWLQLPWSLHVFFSLPHGHGPMTTNSVQT